MKRQITAVMAVAAAAGLMLVAPASAGALSRSVNGCPADGGYSTSGGASTWVGDPNRMVQSPGPISLTLSVQSGDSTTTTVGGSAGASVDLIVTAAKADISASIAKTVSAGTTYGATFSVPSGKTGWLQWGNWGYHYNWQYGSYTGGCVYRVTSSGTASSPTLSGKGFNHGLR